MHAISQGEMFCPIMLCFNDNYVLPAGVAIWSLLVHADKRWTYPIHVVHSDISERHQEQLRKTVSKFSNASIAFIQADATLDKLWTATKGKFSFSKDVYCKLLVGDLFPQYKRILITDVDVVFLDDIRPLFDLAVGDDFAYAGIRDLGHPKESAIGQWCAKHALPARMGKWERHTDCPHIGGGLLIANLDYLRGHRLCQEMVDFTLTYGAVLSQAEQDVINVVCGPYNIHLPLRAMICSCHYVYDRKYPGWRKEISHYTSAEIDAALAHPIQLHYAAGHLKPWNNLAVPKSGTWLWFCIRSGWSLIFLAHYVRLLPELTCGFLRRSWRFLLRKVGR